MIYFDSNALIKLVRAESESDALQDWLDDRADEPMVASELACAEVVRALRRNNHTEQGVLADAEQLALDLADADYLLESVELITLTRELLVAAGTYQEPMLRTLDAIHLVSALAMASWSGDCTFVSYDKRLAAAARGAGLTVVAPA